MKHCLCSEVLCLDCILTFCYVCVILICSLFYLYFCICMFYAASCVLNKCSKVLFYYYCCCCCCCCCRRVVVPAHQLELAHHHHILFYAFAAWTELLHAFDGACFVSAVRRHQRTLRLSILHI